MQDWLKNVDRYAKAAERARDAGNWTAFIDLISLAAGSLAAARDLEAARSHFEKVTPVPPPETTSAVK